MQTHTGMLGSVQAAVAGARQPRDVLAAANQPADVQKRAARAHLECNVASALAMQSPQEWRRWLVTYVRQLAADEDEVGAWGWGVRIYPHRAVLVVRLPFRGCELVEALCHCLGGAMRRAVRVEKDEAGCCVGAGCSVSQGSSGGAASVWAEVAQDRCGKLDDKQYYTVCTKEENKEEMLMFPGHKADFAVCSLASQDLCVGVVQKCGSRKAQII
eukprot:831928-Pelagomonas_calceolata.AAC.4